MEIPAEVLIHSEILGAKGMRGRLLQVSPHGYYEVVCSFGEKQHRVLLPVAQTVIISAQPEAPAVPLTEVER